MLELDIKESQFREAIGKVALPVSEPAADLGKRVKLLILRDLLSLSWETNFKEKSILITPPKSYDKDTIRKSMALRRNDIIFKNLAWINKHLPLAQTNLADGSDVLQSTIKPIIEVCETEKQHALFRLFRYYWASPYSEYVGRRIKLIIRDGGLKNKPVIGIAALGSPIIHIPERDEWIGWDTKTRTRNLVYAMDAYIIGALPPYNHLLGGKLISYILASDEVRKIYTKKYRKEITIIEKRTAFDLACIFTTSLYGRSSQYNRIKYLGRQLYIPIGSTKGYGTLHLSDSTIEAMLRYLDSKGISIKNKFGDGPSWKMRVIRTVGDSLGFDSDTLLQHSFKRDIYAVPLAKNFKKFLTGKDSKPKYFHYSLKNLTNHWKRRWLSKRKLNPEIQAKVLGFKAQSFNIPVDVVS